MSWSQMQPAGMPTIVEDGADRAAAAAAAAAALNADDALAELQVCQFRAAI